MADKKKWIQKANLKEGAFKADAKKDDRTVAQQIEWAKKSGSKLQKKRANLAETLRKLVKSRKKKKSLMS